MQPLVLGQQFDGSLEDGIFWRSDLLSKVKATMIRPEDEATFARYHRTQVSRVTHHVVTHSSTVVLEVFPTYLKGKSSPIGDQTVWGRVYYRPDLDKYVCQLVNVPNIQVIITWDTHHDSLKGAVRHARKWVQRYAPPSPEGWVSEFLANVPELYHLFPYWEEHVGDWVTSYKKEYPDDSFKECMYTYMLEYS